MHQPWGDRFYVGPYPRRSFWDGTPDNSFSMMPGIYSYSYHMFDDGSVVVGGGADSYEGEDGELHFYDIMKVDPTGALDTTWALRTINYTGNQGYVSSIVELDDGRSMFSGTIYAYGNVPTGHIVRTFADGSLDPSFNTTIIRGYAHDILEDDDGKLLAVGEFGVIGEPDTLYCIRLLTNG